MDNDFDLLRVLEVFDEVKIFMMFDLRLGRNSGSRDDHDIALTNVTMKNIASEPELV